MKELSNFCEWETASGTCAEPAFYEITYCNEANALISEQLCFHHAHELARNGKFKIYWADKIKREEEQT